MRQEAVQACLRAMEEQCSIEPLVFLLREEFRFEPVDCVQSRDDWPSSLRDLLADDPRTIAMIGGIFVIDLHLAAEDVPPDAERRVIMHVLDGGNDALFVVSNRSRTYWHVVSVNPAGRQAEPQRRVLQRMAIGPGEPLFFLSERLSFLSLRPVAQGVMRAFDAGAMIQQFFASWRSLLGRLVADLVAQTGDAAWSHAYALDWLDQCLMIAMLKHARHLGQDFRGACRTWVGDEETPLDLVLTTARTRAVVPDRFAEEAGEVLRRYPVTVREDTALDRTLALTPAIFGASYELFGMGGEGDARIRAGVYYTPPTEVDLMCRLALSAYLTNILGEAHRRALYDVVFALEAADEGRARDVVQALPESIGERLNHAISTLTVLDPACGSGAFLIGMLRVLAGVAQLVNSASGKPALPFQQRLEVIITRNLYGCDVQRPALKRAEMRIFLAHREACPFTQAHFPVPHLTHGDSLLETPHGGDGTGRRYDILIGNPPYIRQERIEDPLRSSERVSQTSDRRVYKQAIARSVVQAFPKFFTRRRTIDGKSDLSLYFFFRGLSWLNDQGVLCYVTSAAWLDVQYGASLQEFLIRHCCIEMILDNQAERTFSAAVNTVISLVSAPRPRTKSIGEWNRQVRFVALRIPYEQALTAPLFQDILLVQGISETPHYRAHAISHFDLWLDGSSPVTSPAKRPSPQ